MPNESEFSEILKQFDEEWEDIKPAERLTFEPLPSGGYEAVVVDVTHTESINGKLGLRIKFEVTAGEYLGRNIFHCFWLTYRGIVHVKRDLEKMGYPVHSAEDLICAEQNLKGKRVLVYVEQEGFAGKKYNRMYKFVKLGSNSPGRESASRQYRF